MALLIDIIIMLLLIGTLAYAFLVDRRVRTLVLAMRDLQPVVDRFSVAVDRTENSVKSLRGEAPAARPAPKRDEEPPLTRTAAATYVPKASAPSVAGEACLDLGPFFLSQRPAPTRPVQLPPGMARVTDKADLVRSFFETIRSREA
ncbi:MAG: flagellar motor switch protein [Paracoccaceae bacterium]|nr:flagellar motor switch protein [Paracoccaceae bacterium]MDP5347129.1 flagellar motor switch protein [Paracoccaceae bacterium]